MRYSTLAGGVLLAFSTLVTVAEAAEDSAPAAEKKVPPVGQILSHVHACSKTLTIRSESMTHEQEVATCDMLGKVEVRYHELFGTRDKPVAHDNNRSLRVNIYRDRDEFASYAGKHFNMPVNNGGMYLEGLPEKKGNQAEFVAYQRKDGAIHNLNHEYTHYLDGRFNLYGDFCAGLHDSHADPEGCPQPSPMTPYLVWWTEGVAEYVAYGADNQKAGKAAAQKSFALSQLFDTGYENNGGTERIYQWGYLAVRYMMEHQRAKIDQMLTFTRTGDYPRAQALMRSWGTSMDEDFSRWLETLAPA